MLKNNDMTVYHKVDGNWKKDNYKDIWWFSKEDAEINTTYSKDNDVNIRVWNTTDIDKFKIGDIVVKGNLDVDIIKQSDLSDYIVYNIIALKNNDYAYNKHIHITASLFETYIQLKKAAKTKQPNGTYIDEYWLIDNYYTQKQSLQDEVSATIYGANLNNILRLKSPDGELEDYLKTKLNNEQDNISKYFVFIDDIQYKIIAVNDGYIDIERY